MAVVKRGSRMPQPERFLARRPTISLQPTPLRVERERGDFRIWFWLGGHLALERGAAELGRWAPPSFTVAFNMLIRMV